VRRTVSESVPTGGVEVTLVVVLPRFDVVVVGAADQFDDQLLTRVVDVAVDLALAHPVRALAHTRRQSMPAFELEVLPLQH
jgi:hypothetical protein